MKSSLLYLIFFCVCTVYAEVLHAETNYIFIGCDTCFSLDIKDAPPIMYLLTTDIDQNNEKCEIIVWKDGDIIWNDPQKSGFYFKASISTESIEMTIRKLKEFKSKHGIKAAKNDYSTFYGTSVTYSIPAIGSIYSADYYKKDYWSMILYEKYLLYQDKLNTNDKSSFILEADNFRERNKRMFGGSWDKEYFRNDSYIYEFFSKLVNDAEYFTVLCKLAKKLKPVSKNIRSQKLNLSIINIKIYTDSNSGTFRYVVDRNPVPVQQCACPTADQRPENGGGNAETGGEMNDKIDKNPTEKGESPK